jgi:L-alanine-DL-glutamate epimerase-like enolase superfamily enzyme
MAAKPTDVRPQGATLYFLPVPMRLPLKFGTETTTHVTCARVRLRVQDPDGRTADGWGETPLSVQWVWPSALPYARRLDALQAFCIKLAGAWATFDRYGHPMEVGHAFLQERLPALLAAFHRSRGGEEPLPWLAALVCCSAFDLALHDAYGVLHGVPVYETYNAQWMSHDLHWFFYEPDEAQKPDEARTIPADEPPAPRLPSSIALRPPSFRGAYPADFLAPHPPPALPAWHLVGGLDPLEPSDLTGHEPQDGYPVLLRDWIRQDGLKCLKVKLRGNDAPWDYARLVKVGQIGIEEGVDWLSADFNCTVTDPAYVNEILDRLLVEHPRLYGMILYVEQPFPYDLEAFPIDVHSVSARKPLFMDESAHDWRLVRLGRALGWTGVALKTCKTQTGALLSLCWARAHGMTLMVQDLTNPMLAQIPHVLLAARARTIMGVETNSMQFYPQASAPEAAVHPGLYVRRQGQVYLSSIQGPGFGYRLNEIRRELPPPVAERHGA